MADEKRYLDYDGLKHLVEKLTDRIQAVGDDYLPLTGGTVSGDLTVSKGLTVNGDTDLNGLTVNGDTDLQGTTTVNGLSINAWALVEEDGSLVVKPEATVEMKEGATVNVEADVYMDLARLSDPSAGTALFLNGSGKVVEVTLDALKSALGSSSKQGVFIAYDDEDGNPRICEINDWYKLEGVADATGIALIAGGLELLISTEIVSESVICEDNNFGDHGVLATSSETYAVHDYDGRENTATLSEAESSSVYRYMKEYAGKRVAAGEWWVPSLGELKVIAMFVDEINDAYDQLTGNMILIRNSTTYVSSTLGLIDDGQRDVWGVRFDSSLIPTVTWLSGDSGANAIPVSRLVYVE